MVAAAAVRLLGNHRRPVLRAGRSEGGRALRSYAEQAHNGQRLQRRLFTEDAVRGFAFVDICHKRFDVVLMNPPFGSVPPVIIRIGSLLMAKGRDILLPVVLRGCRVPPQDGFIGSSRHDTALFLPDFTEWRRRVFFDAHSFSAVSDLGYGVLDTRWSKQRWCVIRRTDSSLPVGSSDFDTNPRNCSSNRDPKSRSSLSLNNRFH